MTNLDHWPELRRIATEEVNRLVRELPKPIRPLVEGIPILFEESPGRGLMDDGVEPDVMGLFVGADFLREGEEPVPPGIMLFLNNIRDEANGHPGRYREEIRKTLLHEIGHYLGLSEDELWERNLD